MKYLIASLITGQAGDEVRLLATAIAKEFKFTHAVTDKIPPHFTLKAPFETDLDQVNEIDELLADFVAQQKSAPMRVAGFGHFGKRAVYLRIVPSDAAREIYQELIAQLKTIGGLSWGNHDGNQKQFHATLVRPKSPQQFREIWQFISHPSQRGGIQALDSCFRRNDNYFSFDNVTLLRHNGDKWVVDNKYCIT